MKLKITFGLLALAGTSFGALINLQSVGANYDGTDDYGVLLSSGNAVGFGAGLAQVGIFSSLTDVQVEALAAAQDYATLFAPGNFTTLASDDFTAVNTAYGATAGFFQVDANGINAAGLNDTLYVYFTSGSELGLFQTNSTIVPDSPIPPESNYFLSLASGTALIGDFGPSYVVNPYQGVPGNVTIVNSFQLVPEPSTALLGAIGVLALLRRRRI